MSARHFSPPPRPRSRTSSFGSTVSSSGSAVSSVVCKCSRYADVMHATESQHLKAEILGLAPFIFPETLLRGSTFKIVGCDVLRRETNRSSGERRSWVLHTRQLVEWPTDGAAEGQKKLVKSEVAVKPDMALCSVLSAMKELKKPYRGETPVQPQQLEAFEKTCSMCGLERRPSKKQ